MKSQNSIEDPTVPYKESTMKLETLIEILVKIVLLFLLVCFGLIFVLIRFLYVIGLILLQTMVAGGSFVVNAFIVPVNIASSTVTVLVSSLLSPMETVTGLVNVVCVSTLVGLSFIVELIRMTVRNFYRVLNVIMLLVRYIVGVVFVLTGVVTAAVALSLANFVFLFMIINRILLFAFLVALFALWAQPVPNDDIWTHTVNMLPWRIQEWLQ